MSETILRALALALAIDGLQLEWEEVETCED